MPPKRKHTSPAHEVGEVGGAAASKEAAQQLPAGAAEAEAVEETLDPASDGGGEPAFKKARGEEPDVFPGSPMLPPGLSESSGSDTLCIDALAAVCEWVGSTADLVRLSCVSRTWRQLVARDGLWRRRFIAERGQPAHNAFALALDLHGHAALTSFLGQACSPPALRVDSAAASAAGRQHDEAAGDADDGGGEIKTAGAGVEETEEGGHGLGVWFDALVSTGALQPLSSQHAP
jgi:hypothetical protein